MDKEPLHLPDFTTPDFAQPALEKVDLSMPGFTMPDPERSGLAKLAHTPLWPASGLERMTVQQPDPALASPSEPEGHAALTLQDGKAHMLTEPAYKAEREMQQRPGELDPSARSLLQHSPDNTELPPRLSYPQLYTTGDEMSTRKRHLRMLELGLEGER